MNENVNESEVNEQSRKIFKDRHYILYLLYLGEYWRSVNLSVRYIGCVISERFVGFLRH